MKLFILAALLATASASVTSAEVRLNDNTGASVAALRYNSVDRLVVADLTVPGQAQANTAEVSDFLATFHAEFDQLKKDMARLETLISTKQDSASAATDTELNNAKTALQALISAKQDSATAATDTELNNAKTALQALISAKQCHPSLGANCFTKNDGSVVSCGGTTVFNEVSQSCEACPEYASCQNGFVYMRTVRTTNPGAVTAEQEFHIPEQMKYDRCKISVEARQTDYNKFAPSSSWSEHLTIKHKDTSVALHENCGYSKQCDNKLHQCELAPGAEDPYKVMVEIDHGSPAHITIQGTNGAHSDYCPFSPKNDLSPHDFAAGYYGSYSGTAWCSTRDTDPDCHYMWAQVKIECCCSGQGCTC